MELLVVQILATSSILIDGFWLQNVPGEKGGNSFSLAFYFFFSFSSVSPFLLFSLFLAHSLKCTKTHNLSVLLYLSFSLSESFHLSVCIPFVFQHCSLTSSCLPAFLHSEPSSTLHKHSASFQGGRIFGELSALPKLEAIGRFSGCICKQLGIGYTRPYVDFGCMLNHGLC